MPSNPSARLARALAQGRAGGDRLNARIEARILPTLWSEAAAFPAVLDAARPDIVLMLGVAGRRRAVCIECLARNATGAFPDTARRRPAAGRLETGAPAQRRLAASPMPLLHALRRAGLPARLSRDAGGYVCNALAWRGYGWAAETDGGRLAVFVHIPLPRPGALSRQRLQRGLEALLVALAAQWRQRAREAGAANT